MKTSIIASLICISLLIAGLVGEVKCIVKFLDCDFTSQTSYKAEITYGLSTVTGIGVVVGYMDFGK